MTLDIGGFGGTKVEIKGLKEELKRCKGEDVMIDISHKLYGDQKVRCNLNYIFDDKRIGFKVKNGQEIFIYRENLVDYGIKGSIYFADDIMKIDIKLHEQ